MPRRCHASIVRAALLPCPLLLLLTGCAPRAQPEPADHSLAATGAPQGFPAEKPPAAAEQALTREQQRNAQLQQQLEERTRQIEELQQEVGRLRAAASADGAGADAPAPETWGHTVAAAAAAKSAAGTGDGSNDTLVTALREAAAREQKRRESAERELAHLKLETSGAAYTGARVPESDLFAVKQELVDLRRTLAQEQSKREQLAAQLQTLQQQAPGVPPSAPPNAETAELEARLKGLQEDKQAIVESFDRALAASQKHAAELEQQLAAVHGGAPALQGAVAGDAAAVQSENAALRASLDEERKRTDLLAAKLRAAQRITDLIFKIRAQQAGGVAGQGNGPERHGPEPDIQEPSPEELLPDRR